MISIFLAKGKRRCKGKTLDLNTFLGDDKDIAPGYAVVPPRRSAIDWADAMENEDLDGKIHNFVFYSAEIRTL